MRFIKDVQSTVSPILIDIESSPTTIYVRENVREELIVVEPRDEQDERQEYIMYKYDETQYDTKEYCLTQSKDVSLLKDQNAHLLLEIAKIRFAFRSGAQTLI